MNVSEIIDELKNRCTDPDGTLDKAFFRVMVAVSFLAQDDTDRMNEGLISEYNKGIYRVLGQGHSLCSCVQFIEGKKAKPYMEIINAAIAKLCPSQHPSDPDPGDAGCPTDNQEQSSRGGDSCTGS